MIEQGIYFALGCIVTALLALGFAPFFWTRALRLTRRRLQLQVPLSMQEILAERDGLRAEFAVEQLRIEQAMERVQATKAADMAEIGRRSAAASALIDQIDDLKAVQRTKDAEIDRLQGALADSGAETSAVTRTLQDTIADRDERVREIARLEEDIARRETEQGRLEDMGESRRTMIASLETRIMGLEMQLMDSVRSSAREEGVSSTLRGRLETAMAQATRHEASGLSLRRELDEAKARIRTLEAESEERDAMREKPPADLEPSQSREESLAASMRGRIETSEAPASVQEVPALSLRRELDEAKARIRTLEGVEMSQKPREMPTEASHDDEADGGLRDSIHALGLAVATMTRNARPDAFAAPHARRKRDKAPSPIDAA